MASADRPSERAAVERRLDTLHGAASRADGAAYFDCFTPDAVFVGTDATERWTLDAFRAYAEPYFKQGRGWTYTPEERHVAFDATGRTAWFDERLANAKYGECRGSGVLVKSGGEWRVAQYVLSFAIPNESAERVVEVVREGR
ncbi:MAG: nuclear transport factor 2 family protein [Planctomycetota bacterium]